MTTNGTHTHNDPSLKIMARLKEETREYHIKLESLPYFEALIDHKLHLESYVNQLQALAVIHGVLENEIGISEDKRVISIWNDGLKKLPLLQEDLKFFEPRVESNNTSSIEAALAMTKKIRLRRIENPITLLGYLYVFEGSTLGNRMHLPDISKTFHLDEMNGCHYYSGYRDEVSTQWSQFSDKMNEVLDNPTLHDPIIEAAHEAFGGLEELYKALYPLDKAEKSFHVARINPEAGNHPIPDDEREIQAALKASTRSWTDFPYYEHRYGERGKRFSDSDTCWLVTLTRFDQKSMQRQIEWIGRLLATRGMPLIMLEQTLKYLHEELTLAIPDNTETYEKLLTSAEILRKARTQLISEKEFESLSNEFDQFAGADLAKKYKNTGRLMVASVVDEKNGIKGAVSALQEWVTDEARFPNKWISGVNDIISKTMEMASNPNR
jgi:heme oxygenase